MRLSSSSILMLLASSAALALRPGVAGSARERFPGRRVIGIIQPRQTITGTDNITTSPLALSSSSLPSSVLTAVSSRTEVTTSSVVVDDDVDSSVSSSSSQETNPVSEDDSSKQDISVSGSESNNDVDATPTDPVGPTDDTDEQTTPADDNTVIDTTDVVVEKTTTITNTITSTHRAGSTITKTVFTTVTSIIPVTSTRFITETVTERNVATATETVYETSTQVAKRDYIAVRRAYGGIFLPRETGFPYANVYARDRNANLLAPRALETVVETVHVTVPTDTTVTKTNVVVDPQTSVVVRDSTIQKTVFENAQETVTITSTLVVTSTSLKPVEPVTYTETESLPPEIRTQVSFSEVTETATQTEVETTVETLAGGGGNGDGSEGLSTGAKAGIGAGAGVVALLAIAGVIVFIRQQRRGKGGRGSTMPSFDPDDGYHAQVPEPTIPRISPGPGAYGAAGAGLGTGAMRYKNEPANRYSPPSAYSGGVSPEKSPAPYPVGVDDERLMPSPEHGGIGIGPTHQKPPKQGQVYMGELGGEEVSPGQFMRRQRIGAGAQVIELDGTSSPSPPPQHEQGLQRPEVEEVTDPRAFRGQGQQGQGLGQGGPAPGPGVHRGNSAWQSGPVEERYEMQ